MFLQDQMRIIEETIDGQIKDKNRLRNFKLINKIKNLIKEIF